MNEGHSSSLELVIPWFSNHRTSPKSRIDTFEALYWSGPIGCCTSGNKCSNQISAASDRCHIMTANLWGLDLKSFLPLRSGLSPTLASAERASYFDGQMGTQIGGDFTPFDLTKTTRFPAQIGSLNSRGHTNFRKTEEASIFFRARLTFPTWKA